MHIKENLKTVHENIPENVEIVAVSKTKPVEDILKAYEAGQRAFGENKAQEMISKQPVLPDDIQWHYIGHLQTNKVKYIVPFVSLIHSIDRLKLLKTINKEAQKADRTVDALLQFHIAEEDTKFGLSLDEARDILNSDVYKNAANINIKGVMGMATFTDDKAQIRREFKELKNIFDILKDEFFSDNTEFQHISSGMSSDYLIAIEESSTIVRLGSVIFGPRN